MSKLLRKAELVEQNSELLEQNTELEKKLTELQDERSSMLETQHHLDARLFDYHSLLRAVRALHYCRELPELLEIFKAIIRDKLDSQGLWVFLYNNEEKQFELQCNKDTSCAADEDESLFNFSLGPGILWQLLCQGEPFLVINQNGEFRFPDLFERKQLRQFPAAMWLPLVMENRPVGILALGPLASGKPFQEREMEFLRTVGEQASVAISSVFLYDQLQHEQEKLDRTIRNVSVLYEISKAVNQIDNMKQLLLNILEQAIKRVGAQKGSIMLYDQEADVLRLQVVRGLPDKLVEERINQGEQVCTTFRPGEGIAGKVFESGKYHLSNNTKKDSAYAHAKTSNIDSILCLPLLMHDEPIGVLNITNKRENQFIEDDIEILTAIANQAALTIAKADLYQMAVTDELTGLYVRRYLHRRLDEELRRAKRYDKPFAIAMLDVDHFKKFNDTYGHEAGDRVLEKVADVLREQTRDVDVVARYGGEEFVVLMPETQAEGAMIGAERYRKALEEVDLPHGDQILHITASFGVAEVSDEHKTGADMMRSADVALYQSKHNGRNRVTLWEPGMKLPKKKKG